MNKLTMPKKHHIFLLYFIVICHISTINGFTMKIIPIDSPNLKMLTNGSSSHERHQLLTNISLSRALRHQKNLTPDEIRSPVYRLPSSFFVTQLQFGEREGEGGFFTPYVFIDTGTDLTWIQCEGCNPCFELSYPNFAYTESTSFTRVGINDPMCLPPSFDFDGSCGYSKSYGFRSPTTSGLLGREDFYFENYDGSHALIFSGLILGCGFHNENFNFLLNRGQHNVIGGIYGLGPGERSIISQLDHQVQGRFSYCLTPITMPTTSQSTMYFGDDAQIRGDATRQVQTISMRTHGLYYLYLSGISVEGKRLEIDPSIFEIDDMGSLTRGFFIDSGTPYSVLAKSAFEPLKEAITEFFKDEYGWYPDPSIQQLDLCYSLPEHEYKEHYFPTVALHFLHHEHGEEVDMVLGKDNMFQHLSEEYGDPGFCMMVLRADDPGPCYLGAFQQVNFKILHDIYNSALSFVPHNCLEN